MSISPKAPWWAKVVYVVVMLIGCGVKIVAQAVCGDAEKPEKR